MNADALESGNNDGNNDGRIQLDVSAVIPVYNGAPFIAKALESVLRQTVPVKSVYVIDDCSTDATVSVVNTYKARDSRITLLINSHNSGPAYSRNRALQIADTPIAAFLDADDWWLPGHVENIRLGFNCFPSASLAFAHTVADENTVDQRSLIPRPSLMQDPVTVLLDHNPIAQSSSAVRIADVLASGGYISNGRFAEDYELWVRLALNGAQFVQIMDATTVQRRHAGQVSTNNSRGMYESAWATRRHAVLTVYGDLNSASHEAINSLLRAQDRDIVAATHTRRREILRLVLDLTAWIPGSMPRMQATEKLLGWRWAFWRGAAYVYDAFPAGLRSWWRRARKHNQKA